jgi:NAD+ synthase (glutamine-hydrolysing)
VLLEVHKRLLPTYDVFDEARYFEPGAAAQRSILEVAGRRVGITICEDLWNDKDLWPSRLYPVDPVEQLAASGVDLLVNLSASPWSIGKEGIRRRIASHAARRHRALVAMVNHAGGNDSLIFDGHSLLCAPSGALLGQAAGFAEDLLLIDTAAPEAADPPQVEVIAQIHAALVLGVRDYFQKTGFSRAVVALSGGIDSAVTCALAVEALGPGAVVGLALPSRYSSDHSKEDALELARALQIRCEVMSIEPMFQAYLDALGPLFGDRPPDVTEENLQSRIRGTAAMALANKLGALVLSTGNKSESAVGYATLYGDTVGALAPLADLYKHQVYALARHLNRGGRVIPERTLHKAPSAELRPNQTDQDSLPPYDLLDEILRRWIEEREPIADIAAAVGQPPSLVQEIVRKVAAAEFKRKQLPPTLRVSSKAWAGRDYPIAQRFRE